MVAARLSMIRSIFRKGVMGIDTSAMVASLQLDDPAYVLVWSRLVGTEYVSGNEIIGIVPQDILEAYGIPEMLDQFQFPQPQTEVML